MKDSELNFSPRRFFTWYPGGFSMDGVMGGCICSVFLAAIFLLLSAPGYGAEITFDFADGEHAGDNITTVINTKAAHPGDPDLTITKANPLVNIWTGAGADNNWSTGGNWSRGTAPVPAESVLINGDKDITIDTLLVEVAALAIQASYSGTITQGSNNLTVSGNFILSGGTFNSGTAASSPAVGELFVGGKFIQTGGTFGGGDGGIHVTDAFILSSETFISTSSNFAIGGDFIHAGGFFTHNNGTVELTGTNQTIAGDTTFYNLIKRTASADILTFTGGTRQTIENSLVLQGAPGQELSVISSSEGTQWEIDHGQGACTIEYIVVQDSNNISGMSISVDAGINTDWGNNTNWDFLPPSTHGWDNGQDALHVMGQPDFISGDPGVSDDTFNRAADVVVDPANNKLYVADRANNRVLRFAYPITMNRPGAELVFGQPDFDTVLLPDNEADCTAAGGTWSPGPEICTATAPLPGSNTFNGPAALALDETGRLWVADRGNNRVVWFDNAHEIALNQPHGDGVLGQPDFTTKTAPGPPTQSSLNSPWGITVDGSGSLFIADAYNHRVLRFDHAASKANGADADAVLGQPDFISDTPNNGGISASSMDRPVGVFRYGAYLFVADGSNARVLRFDNASSLGNGADAARVLGQPDFLTASHVTGPADRNRLESAGKAEVDGSGNLYVCDGFNNDRVVIFNDVLSKANGGDGDKVLGQADLTDSGDGLDRNRFSLDSHGGGMAFDNIRGLLFVADDYNNRVMIFEKKIAGPRFSLKQGGIYCPSGTTFDFGAQEDGGETLLTFYIENPGDTPLTFDESPVIIITGTDADQFSVKTQAEPSVASQGATSFQIAFSPTSSGVKTAAVAIVHDSGGETPFNLMLTGTGAGDPGPEIITPSVFTDPISEIMSDSARGGGQVVSDGNAPVAARGVCWSTFPNPTTGDNITLDGSGPGSFSSRITGLDPDMRYHVRAYAVNSAGTGYGDPVSFTTEPVPLPVLTTTPASEVTHMSAASGGHIPTDTDVEILTRGVCWSTSPNPATTNRLVSAGSGLGTFTARITGLEPDTQYHVRAYAVTASDLLYGDGITFTTESEIQTVLTTTPASEVTHMSAVSGGHISTDAGGDIMARGVCWSTAANPTIIDNLTSDGRGAGSFASEITGLEPDTLYHVRAYAATATDILYGDQVSFTTDSASRPVLTTAPASEVTHMSAVSGGNISTGTGVEIVARGVCWSTAADPAIEDNITLDGTGTGAFTSEITGLEPDTQYHVRAYARTATDILYGDSITFATEPVSQPVLTTAQVKAVTHMSAVSGGNISTGTGVEIVARGVCWSTSVDPIVANSVTSDGSGTGSFTSEITGLEPDTQYHVRAYAVTPANILYGDSISFTTESVSTLVLTTAPVSAVTHMSAVSGGNIPIGTGADIKARGVCWSTSADPTIVDGITSNGTGTGSFTSNITGLDPDTIYHVRAYAATVTDIVYGDDVSFTTLTGITAPLATLSGLPDSITNATSYWVIVGGIGVESYRFRLDNNDWSPETTVDQPVIFDVDTGGSHTLYVIGADSAGNWQEEANATTIAWTVRQGLPTAALTGGAGAVTNQTSAEFSVGSAPGSPDIEEYYYSMDGGVTWAYGKTTEPIEVDGLEQGKYTLAVNGFGNGVWQDDADGMTMENATFYEWRVDLTPADPAVLDVAKGEPPSSSVTLSWRWFSDDDQERIQKYLVWYSPGMITRETLGNATEVFCGMTPGDAGFYERFTVDMLAPGQTYYFAVQSVDAAGNISGLSTIAAQTTENMIPRITDLALVSGGTAGENSVARRITITGANFMEYPGGNIVRFENDASVFSVPCNGGTTLSILADIPEGAPTGVYHLRVINKNGTSLLSGAAYTVTESLRPLPEVTNVSRMVLGKGGEYEITIRGRHFDEAIAGVRLVGPEGALLFFSDIVWVDASTLIGRVHVPSDSVEGHYVVQVINSDGSGNGISAVTLHVSGVRSLGSETAAVKTTGVVTTHGGAFPVTTTLTTDNRDEVPAVSRYVARIEVTFDPGTVLEEEGNGGWTVYDGQVNPPRQMPLSKAISDRLGKNSILFSMGAETCLKLKGGGTLLAEIEVALPDSEPVPTVYYVDGEESMTLAGVDEIRDGVHYYPGGSVLTVRHDVPEPGLTTYAIGLVLDHMSTYAAGSYSEPEPDPEPKHEPGPEPVSESGGGSGGCFIGTTMAGFSAPWKIGAFIAAVFFVPVLLCGGLRKIFF
ncbi:MAG: choice-of-anchor D domain-containing protein [Desulfobacteraceae bacterium]|nr:choice-of-anchor D domain-containing protein [Desulfobacteraceae bacterium]